MCSCGSGGGPQLGAAGDRSVAIRFPLLSEQLFQIVLALLQSCFF